jgi:hypothetical protein
VNNRYVVHVAFRAAFQADGPAEGGQVQTKKPPLTCENAKCGPDHTNSI